MSRREFYLSMVPAPVCLVAYWVTGSDDILWLFAATWSLINARANQIMSEVEGAV
ncbi:hypothetical protein PP357_gp62 [Arthrobacter phage Sarge]|uniref:Uncharacterized protein n=1 Tax=Arthrobacter phage Sarge TaxID=2885974 RepID=A0AAE8Y5F6_9CAUD|nr:hypothetical protein PP357_gp62 [Arthrobacter phage Sarge]UDL14909.1 hypothetical protein SEA_SARGE_62 [Arthrobacter phage Sarge]